jgi:hypothetical protein
MTLIYIPYIHFYMGWEHCCAARKLQFSCTKECLKLFWGCFELIWDWIDIFPSHGAQTNDHGR